MKHIQLKGRIKRLKQFGHIIFALGILLVALFTYLNPPTGIDPKHALVLLLVGLVVGLIDIKKEQATPFLLAFIGLIITASAPLNLIEIYSIGAYLKAFFINLAIFLSLAVGVVSVRMVYRIYKESA